MFEDIIPAPCALLNAIIHSE